MKLIVSIALTVLGLLVTGCVSFSSEVGQVGPATEYSSPDRRMKGLVTLVELDAGGFERSRTNDFSKVSAALGLSEATIAAAERADTEWTNDAPLYMEFMEPENYSAAQYPSGPSGHRRLEFDFPSPSKRCPKARLKLSVQWRWRQNRVTRSKISGYFAPPLSDPCIPGSLKAERVGGRKGTSEYPGHIYYNFWMTFSAPKEDLKTGEIVEPATSETDYVFAAGGVSVRGDGTARYGGSYGLADK